MPVITYRHAVFAEEPTRDENAFLMDEEVARHNGDHKVTGILRERFGSKRIIETPISEAILSATSDKAGGFTCWI